MSDGLAQTGEAMLVGGNVVGAERMARRIFETDPRDRNGLLLLGMVEDKRGNVDAALDLYGRIIARDSRDDDARTARIMTLLCAKRVTQAREELADLERAVPGSDHIRMVRVMASMARVNIAETKERLAALRETQPDSVEADLAEAAVALGESRNGDAYRLSLEALAKDPADDTAQGMAATAAFWSFRPRRARYHAQMALRRDPRAASMRGLKRMGRAIWLPPVAVAYACVVGQDMLSGKVSTLVATGGFLAGVQFAVVPVVRRLTEAGLPMVWVALSLCGGLAYVMAELYVVPFFEKRRAIKGVVLQDY